MLSGEIVKRMFSVVLTRPYNDFCGLNGINNRMLAREEMYGWYKNIILSDKKKPTPNDIRELALSSECDFIVIDYLGFMGTDRPCKSRLEEIGNNVREIKNLAGELRIPILLLSQLNREGVKEGVRPQPYHLKESGEIEQTADKIVLLNKKQQIDTQDRDTVDIELIIAKNRNGPVTNDIGELELIYRKNCFRFYDR
jgi:replicative DNA helicase